MSRPQARTIVRTGFQEFTQHGRGPELRDRLQVVAAEVKAFERLQMVRGRNPLYFGSQ